MSPAYGNRYGRWEDAMIAQSRIASWYDTRDGLRYLAAFFADMNRKHQQEARRDPRLLASIQVTTLREAEPVYVSADVTEIVDHARHSFEPEPVRPTDPFVPTGFALFPRPLILMDGPRTDANPHRSPTGEIPIRALAWHSMHSEDYSLGTFWISYYADFEDELELGITREEDAADGWISTQEIIDAARQRSQPLLSLVHQWQWNWHSAPWTEPENLDVLPEDGLDETMQRAKAQTQLVQSFWRIASQIVPGKERPPRAMRRERLRRGMTEDVTVIRLRRTGAPRPEGESDRRLTRRHLVRGYWARRHFRDGTRQVWVRPHIRGDESLPLVLTTRAWEFTR